MNAEIAWDFWDKTREDTQQDTKPGIYPKLGTALTRSQLAHLPKIRPLVAGLMSQPSACVLIGSYSVGKSVLAHSLACAIATGRPWLGQTVEQRRVLFVVGEGAPGLDDRLTAWERAWNQGQRIGEGTFTTLVKPASLSERATWQQLTEFAMAGGYGFVVLDTFSSLAPDADETKDAALIMRHLSDLSAHIDGTVLLVHHPGWGDSKRARGGYQFEANADEVLIMNGIPGEALVSLTRKKVKEGVSGSTLWLRRVKYDPSVIFEWADPAAVEVPLRQRISSVLDAHADVGATGPQIIAACEIPDTGRSGFYAALNKLRHEGQVKTTGARNTLRYFIAEHAPEDAE